MARSILIRLFLLLLGALPALVPAAPAHASRIKDIASFEGARDNMLVGYGLVVGLNGSGDNLTRDIFTFRSLIGMLDRLGIDVNNPQLNTTDVAAVMVTATLSAFSREGARIDVNVSAMGDATNLQGGTLIVTPLLGADGEVYAVAQGQVAVSGFVATGAASTVTKGVPTAGSISNGAIVERELNFDLRSLATMNIALRNPDFTTAQRVATAINGYLGQDLAQPRDAGTVQLVIPPGLREDIVSLMTGIEQLNVVPDEPARVVIDEASGTIVMGENVRVSTVAVVQGNLTVRITETPQVSQPGAFAPAGAQTTVVPRTDIQTDEQAGHRFAIVPQGVTIQQLVNSLNALGLGPRDMIPMLQTIKAAGAMQADLEIR
jgi:flagellar P-ring protein precursor FlgI